MAYSVAEMTSIAKSAGFDNNTAKIMGAIGMAESSGNAMAHNTNAATGDNSYGLWQINMLGSMGPSRRKSFGISSNDELFNPSVNARAAYKIYKSQGLRAWSTYSNGDYKKYLGAAGGKSAGLGNGYSRADYASYSTGGTTVDLTKAPAGTTQAAWDDLLRVFPPYELYKFFQGDPLPDIPEGLADFVPGLEGLSSIAKSVEKTTAWITTPSNWVRVLYVIGGGVVIVAGIAYLAKDTAIQGVAGSALKAVKGGAKSIKKVKKVT